MERWRLMLLGNPQMMDQMRRVSSAVVLAGDSCHTHTINTPRTASQENPEMARTIESDPEQFARLTQQTLAGGSREREKQRQIEVRGLLSDV